MLYAVSKSNNCNLYGLQHNFLCNTFHTVNFGMPSSPFALAINFWTSLKCFAHSFSMLSRHMRTVVFTQASKFYKLLMPSTDIIFVQQTFTKPCMKLTLHCNNRFWYLKVEHTESFLLLRHHLGNQPALSIKSLLMEMHQNLKDRCHTAEVYYWIHIRKKQILY